MIINKSHRSYWTFLSLLVICFALYSLITPVVESASREGDAEMMQKSASGFIKPDDKQLRQSLTELQYHVTQEEGTERAFTNEYWNNKKPGIYVDIVSGEPLFSSKHKYDSKTGWPSFTQPIEGVELVKRVDRKLFYSRTELRSKLADSHLGHVFDDGPAPTGKRYCINSASLRFIPKEEMETAGYKNLLGLVD